MHAVGLSVLIVDDHESFRASARTVLEDAGYRVVGEVADGASGVEAATQLRPDIMLLDIQLPDTDGFEVARRVAAGPQPPAIVLISSRDASDYRRRLRDAPAVGFIGKADLSGAALAELIGASP